jgi:hypothetical protein
VTSWAAAEAVSRGIDPADPAYWSEAEIWIKDKVIRTK